MSSKRLKFRHGLSGVLHSTPLLYTLCKVKAKVEKSTSPNRGDSPPDSICGYIPQIMPEGAPFLVLAVRAKTLVLPTPETLV